MAGSAAQVGAVGGVSAGRSVFSSASRPCRGSNSSVFGLAFMRLNFWREKWFVGVKFSGASTPVSISFVAFLCLIVQAQVRSLPQRRIASINDLVPA